jgi:Domain of unknown function (DUF4926)
MIKELDTVVLTRDIPERQLCQGDLGAVVLVHADGQAYEVEFVTLGGETVAVMTLLPTPCAPSRGARSRTCAGWCDRLPPPSKSVSARLST